MNWTNFILISINLVFGYLVYLRMNQNGRHLVINRWFLITFPLFSAALGLLYHYSNGVVLNGLSIHLPLIETHASSTSIASPPSINWLHLTYITGVSLSLLHFFWSIWKVRTSYDVKFLNRLGKQRIYLVSNSSHSFSHLNSIYISEFELNNVEFILKHELAHSRQKHSLDIFLIRMVRSFLWFNPIIYLWERKMKENHEYLADRACVQNNKDFKSYSYALLSSHLGVSIPNLASGFNRQSMLKKRIIQLKTQNTFNMKKVILIPALLAGVALMTSVQLTSSADTKKTTDYPFKELLEGDNEQQPEFAGGLSALTKYIQENVKYPKEFVNKDIEVKVYVKFVVAKSGKVKDVAISRGSEHEVFNKEAIRLVSNMPKWVPGMKDGKAVSTEMTLPFSFKPS